MSIQGLDPYLARQYLLHHAYSPVVSVQSSHHADKRMQSSVKSCDGFSALLILEPYGNNAKYSVPNQTFKFTNSQLITRGYPSFPIRFQPCLVDQLSVLTASESKTSPNKIRQLFAPASLEMYMRHISSLGDFLNDFYLELFSKVISSSRLVPFETFNHPVCQLFVIDFHTDTLASLRQMIVNFRNYNFPKYFQIDDLLMHVLVLYDPEIATEVDISTFQAEVRRLLSLQSTFLPVSELNDDVESFVVLNNQENSTIEEELQRLSFENANGSDDVIQIPRSLDSTIKQKLYEFIGRHLIPHMTDKVRHWDDSILAPKKSFTGRFFSVSKKLFNNDNTSLNNNQSSHAFNSQGNFYPKSSVEQTLRKLADWSLILKDFKYAYSTYDLIKKDYNNDRAWAYVASTQEMCVVSLLLAQTQQTSQVTPPDKNTLRKIKHDIVEPYMDSLVYTYKSRLNIKTYGIRASLVVIELLLCMCTVYNMSWWWTDLIERYLCKCIADFESNLNSGSEVQVIKALLYERLGFCLGKYVFTSLPNIEESEAKEPEEANDQGFYKNTNKLSPANASMGLTREKQASLWYLLSIKEWALMKNYKQASQLLPNILSCFTIDKLTDEWYDRPYVLLGFIKRQIEKNDGLNTMDIDK